MADKTYSELNAVPNPIPTDYLMTFGNPDTQEALRGTISQFVEQVFPVTTSLQVFYVDGNNPNSGDGSILNPFQTLEAAFNKVLGTGTRDNPQFQNVQISVAAYSYTTSSNIWMNNVTWNFADGTVVNFNNAGNYFIDSSVVSTSDGLFQITGGLRFNTTNGGFILNSGMELSLVQSKHMSIEAYSINGSTPLGSTSNPTLSTPLIQLIQTASGGGFQSINLDIVINGTISSKYQTIIYQQKGNLTINGAGVGQLVYGVDEVGGTLGGHVQGCIHNYVNNDTTGTRRYLSYFTLINLNVAAIVCNAMFSWTGGTNSSRYERLYILNPAQTATVPVRFLTLNNIFRTYYVNSSANNNVRLLLKEIEVIDGRFSNDQIIASIGTTAAVSILEMEECALPAPYFVDSNVSIGAQGYGNVAISAFNIINGFANVTNLPVYANNAAAIAGGMPINSMYKTSTGQLMITQ